jgi:hypothetical protein
MLLKSSADCAKQVPRFTSGEAHFSLRKVAQQEHKRFSLCPIDAKVSGWLSRAWDLDLTPSLWETIPAPDTQ